ncbi:MAG: type II and III secretion system protein, partial [Magnetococcales bacterium]|nr:type II and III secretion system protein [Magnetococcales bacterium]
MKHLSADPFRSRWLRAVGWGVLALGMGCVPAPPAQPLPGPATAATSSNPAPAEKEKDNDIPGTVKVSSFLPKSEDKSLMQSTYTVVVTEVPVKDVLFALARDAHLNVDIVPGIIGNVTLNAIDQTLPKILERIAHQANIRYEIRDNLLFVEPDLPFRRNYRV